MASTLTLTLALFLILAVAGCGGGGDEIPWLGGGKDKAPASAVWITPRSGDLSANEIARLKGFGVTEVYLTAARLTGTPGTPLESYEITPPEGSMPSNLVLEGTFDLEADAVAAYAESVTDAARQLRFDIESRGALVVGVHFDIHDVRDPQAYAAFLERVRDGLDDELFLSASIPRGWDERPGAREVARAVDYFVAFLYGQRLGETESGAAWDFLELERSVRVLDEWGVPYQVGVVLLGSARLLGTNGTVHAVTSEMSLQDIVRNRRLDMKPAFSLEGVNRRVYEVTSSRGGRLGEWKLGRGEMVRVVRAAASDIEELLRLLDVWNLPNHRGQAYYRVPGAEEDLSLQVESLLAALDTSREAEPDLALETTLQRRTGRGWLMRFSIQNRNGEFTELATLDNNFLQVRVLDDGRFNRNKIAAGDFYRFQLYRTDREGALETTFRDAEVVRFHVPILEGEQRISTGDVEVVARSEPRIEASASFLLPDGRTLEVGPVLWPDSSETGR
ncbi:MAG: hypothetical protein AAGC60_02720 [Acidobacteriota bacterium]